MLMQIGVSMKYKIITYILVCIICVLVIRLYVKESFYTTNTHVYKVELNMNKELQELVKAENEAYDRLAYEQRVNRYTKLFPDMYVESIKPIIQVEEVKIAYLSFDDGPSKVTNQILDTLKEKEAKATFFIIAGNVTDEKVDYLKRMIDEGHSIGIHTFSHDYRDIYQSVEAYLEDFYKAYQLIYESTGVKSTIFRFPWGSTNNYNKRIKNELKSEMERRGFRFYDWNVSAEDSTGSPSATRIKQNVLKDLERFNSPIILMHDSAINKNTAKVLPDIVTIIKEKGYTFDTLDNRAPYHFKY